MVTEIPNVRLNLTGGVGSEQVVIDGHDVSKSVMELTVHQKAGDIPTLELECLAFGEVTMEGHVAFYALADGQMGHGATVREAVRDLADRLDAAADEASA